MNTVAARLTRAIEFVCPIYGVSIGRRDDRSTWRIDFKEEATIQNRRDAVTVLNEFDPAEPPEPPTVESRLEALEARITALEAR